ncbi:MAG: hypothetical protein PF482_06965 [Desulfobacteraceae bacterium]|jgi:rubrerythrin|nr:hypothetical protein [Desulfobacteraceae bacterium]
MISRRQLLYFSALFAFCYPIANLKYFAAADDINDVLDDNRQYPLTLNILKKAYWAEITAHKHYNKYCQKAFSEDYPNIAYLFSVLSVSEKIHADNYKKIIISLSSTIEAKEISVSIGNTKKNLNTAAKKELEKINKFYPEILKELSSESHDQAVINCMYSWQSHQQHKKMITDIKNNSGFFFKHLAKKIENMKPNFYVCEICGSTVDEKPTIPCEICNYPVSHYMELERPAY